MNWIDIQKDDAHIKRERAKARELRQSAWWKQQCQGGVCHYCKQNVGVTALTMDHIVPVARGGTSTKGNVVPSCKECNNKKTFKTPAEQILEGLFPGEGEDHLECGDLSPLSTTPSCSASHPFYIEGEVGAANNFPFYVEGVASRRDDGVVENDDKSPRSISPQKTLLIAAPHGFCSGVARAIRMAETALTECGLSSPHAERGLENPHSVPIYCLNEIVHNQHVVAQLTAKGMRFVRSLADVPEGAQVLFSAHGVSPAVRREAERRNLRVIDATCPFVEKVHAEVRRFAATDAAIICIGHRNHEEVIGVAGEAPGKVIIVENAQEVELLALPPDQPIAVVTQTTLGAAQVDAVMDALRKRFTAITTPPHSDICYATRDRQDAVRALAKQCDCVIVLGSANSSNSQRLVETAQEGGGKSVLISDLADLEKYEWEGIRTLGITSGASTPEAFLEETVRVLVTRFGFALI